MHPRTEAERPRGEWPDQVEVGPGHIAHKQAAHTGKSLSFSSGYRVRKHIKHLPTIIIGHLLHTWARPWGQALEPKS